MSSQGQKPKRDIADFFKRPAHTVPQKRPSPSGDHQHDFTRPSKARSPTPQTPRHKHVSVSPWDSSPFKSPFGPGSASSLPIRSPQPPKSINKPIYGPGPLFKRQSSSVESSPIPPSLKSLEQYTFADVPTTARSVVKDGNVVVVLDSDEDTDSLESLEDIFGRRQEDSATSSSSPPELEEAKAEAERRKTLNLFTGGRSDPLVGKEKLRALVAKEREAKFDISRLMGDHFDDDEVERNLEKAREGYEASTRESKQRREHGDVDRSLLASVVRTEDGDEDGVSRLMSAVERTEVFTSEKSFSFFGQDGLKDWKVSTSHFDFPEDAQVDELWQHGDANSRNRAYLSGYMAEIASRGDVDDSILAWTFKSVVLEQRDELRQAYIRCLEHASVHWTKTNVTASDVQTVFQTLGAESAVLRDGSTIESMTTRRNSARRDPKFLLSGLEMFRAIARDMDFTALSKLISLTVRLALDVDVISDSRVSLAVEDIISTLLELSASEAREHIAERLIFDAGSHLHEPVLQAQLLTHILPTTPLAAKVRILLAERFLFGSGANSNVYTKQPTVSLPALTKHLYTPAFDISAQARHNTVNYTNLKATTLLLDAAIADGNRPSFDSRADEVAFNRQVDVLADRMKAIFASIADTGASHMRRTEAKEAMQAVYYRLLYAVRTEPRPKKNVFGGRDGDEYRSEERSKGFMTKFLSKQKEQMALREADAKTVPLSSPCTEKSSSTASEKSETEMLIRRNLELN